MVTVMMIGCVVILGAQHGRGYVLPQIFVAADRWVCRSTRAKHLRWIGHKTKNAVQTIASNIIETGIGSKSAPHNPFRSLSTLRSFTGAVASH